MAMHKVFDETAKTRVLNAIGGRGFREKEMEFRETIKHGHEALDNADADLKAARKAVAKYTDDIVDEKTPTPARSGFQQVEVEHAQQLDESKRVLGNIRDEIAKGDKYLENATVAIEKQEAEIKKVEEFKADIIS